MSVDKDTLEEMMLANNYVIFAPMSERDLRVQWPELSDYEEFRSLKVHDMLFVWWYRCASSPYYNEEDSSKLEKCIDRAYPTEQQRASKLLEFREKLPDNVKVACKRMESFNRTARVENYIQTKMVRDNCKAMLAADVDKMTPEDKEAWAKRAPGLWKLMDETTKTLERGAYGVAAIQDTRINEQDGTLRAFRQSRK